MVYNYAFVNNLLAGIEIPGTGTITTGAYKWARPETTLLPGGGKQTRTYDPLMRTQSITASDPGQNDLMAYTYAHDDLDNITKKSTEHGDYDYSYDNLQRLASAENPEGQEDEAFTYDGVGNRLTQAGSDDPLTYNQNNELESLDDTSYEYDTNGNMIQKTVNNVITLFFYNIEDRLERVEDDLGNIIATYGYDPFGRRIWKEVTGTKTHFMYADEGLIGEYTQAGAEIKTYGWKPGGTWGTDPLFIKQGSKYFFYQNDHLGTPQKMMAVNGAVVWSAKYSSFGEAEIDPASTVENNLRFAGQYEDGETGLHYNWQRYYDQDTGRYLTPGPIGLAGGINPFVYTDNNPINFIDPDGLWALQVAGAIIGGGANAHKNYSAYKSGRMSGLDYTKSIAFGAGSGVLSSFGGPALGALLSGINSVHDQTLLSNNSPCHEEIDWSEAGRAVVIGFAVGNIAKGAYKAGDLVIKMPNIIGAEIGSKATQVVSYGTRSGIIANAAGTYLID